MRISDWSSDVCSSDLIDWVQSTAACMVPSDPWERLLVSGVARDLQQIRLDFLSEAKGKDIHAHVDSWLAAKEKRVDQFRALVKRARAATATKTAMLAELRRSEEHTFELQSLMRIPYA